MSLLDFARGPALEAALAIFCFGVIWRLASLLLLPRMKDNTVGRPGAPSAFSGAFKGFMRHMWVAEPYRKTSFLVTLNGYIFHLGLAIIVFGLGQHILFIRDLLGISWPNLPSGFIQIVAVLTLASLIAALARRLSNPVVRLISTFNDYFSWLITFLPVLTGLIAVNHLWFDYEYLLAAHLLSVAALLIWFPFGKLMHAFLVFITRSQTGITYSRRGVEI